MSRLGIKVGLKVGGVRKLKKALNDIAKEDWKGVLRPFGAHMQRQVAKTFREQKDPVTGEEWKPTSANVLKTRPKGGGGGKTLSDTRALLQSIIGTPPEIRGYSVSIGSNLVYALIHQKGGIIRPKKSKYLAIPVTREARKAGSASRWFKQNEEIAQWLFGKNGIYGLGAQKKQRGQMVTVVHFVLKKQINIPTRRFLGFGQQDKDMLARMVTDRIVKLARGGR